MGTGGIKKSEPKKHNFRNESNEIDNNSSSNFIREDQDSSNYNHINEEFKSIFPLKYDSKELDDLLINFLKKPRIQDSFLCKKDSEDYPFNLLKEKELNDLSAFFNKNQSKIIDSLETKMKEFNIPNDNFKSLTLNILSKEEAKAVCTKKIKKEIKNIENNVHESEINYLSVMIVGKSGVGKSTLINSLLKLKKNEQARTGVGKFQTTKISDYRSENFPFLRLIDTRGIELNIKYVNIYI